MPRSRVCAILPKKDSTRLSQDPCLGVKVNSKRFGSAARKVRVGQPQKFDEFHAPVPMAHPAQNLA